MKFLRFGGALLGGLVLSILFASSAHAASWTINNSGDGSDANTADGICEVNVGVGDCTLRAAIEQSNATADASNIFSFDIPGAGPHTITPASLYDNINGSTVVVDAVTSQTGASCGSLVPTLPSVSNTPHDLKVRIDLASYPGGSTVLNAANGSVDASFRGLNISNAANADVTGIGIPSAIAGTVECNYLGTDITGTIGEGVATGVYVSGSGYFVQNNLLTGNDRGISASGDGAVIQNNLIGTKVDGNTADGNGTGLEVNNDLTIRQNVVAGNFGNGVLAGGYGIVITGNFIGVSLNGSALGNDGDGILLSSANDFSIGGELPADRNVISANAGNGIHILNAIGPVCPSSVNSQTQGNYIGTNLSGNVASGYGNQESGIAVNEVTRSSCGDSVYKHSIGGDATGEQNVIAGNTQDGIRVYQALGTDVFSISAINNSVYSNGNLGINLAADNDDEGTADADLGPNAINTFMMSYPATNANYYINHPTINSVSYTGSEVTVNYSYQANGIVDNYPYIVASDLVGFRLDYYINPSGQDGAYAGYSQGKTHLGSFIVDGSETNATHTFTSPVPVSGSEIVTVTATALWTVLTNTGGCPVRLGDGPPYDESTVNCPN